MDTISYPHPIGSTQGYRSHAAPSYTVLSAEPGCTRRALSRAGLASSLNWNGLHIGPRIKTWAGNWWREREYTVLCFSFEPRIKDSRLWTGQKAKGQARILRSIKNENKNTSTLSLLLLFIAISSQTVSLWQSGD